MARPVSIRRSLLAGLVVVIVVMGAAIMGTTVVGERTITGRLSAAVISRALDQADARLDDFFDPVVEDLPMVRAWSDEGLLDLDQPARIDGMLLPLMANHPQVSAIIIADGRGREHLLQRLGDAWSRRRVRRDEWGSRAHFLSWSADHPEPVEAWREIDYDPRTRPWYAGAREAAGRPDNPVHWTEPYSFYTTGEPGITAAVAAAGDRVIGFDVLLNDISDFTFGLQPSANGFAFVLSRDGRLVGLPRLKEFADEAARRDAILRRPEALDIRLLRDGADAYFAERPQGSGAYRFRNAGEPWWAGARRIELAGREMLGIVVAVPEADLVGSLTSMRLLMGGVTLSVLAAAIWRAAVLARRYSAPIESLVRQSERISRGDLEPGSVVESPVKEVRRLAAAHERMRQGLTVLMKLERDLQLARQIQEGTFPDTLPRLAGFDIAAWSEPADETGGDTYDVVGLRWGAGGSTGVTTGRADRAVLLLADATGHGIGPALSVAQVRAMLRMALRTRESLPSIVRHLNEQLNADLPEGRFITAWLGELDAAAGTLASFSAGQAPILRYRAASDEMEVLEADTLPLGVVAGLEVELAGAAPMAPGDVLAVISDGIFEAANGSGEQFGARRVADVIREHRRAGPSEIIAEIREAVVRFTNGAPAADDRTGIVVKRI